MYRMSLSVLGSKFTSPIWALMRAVDTLNYIKKAPRVRFTGPRWAAISNAAKDCIRGMLDPNPNLRPTATQVGQQPHKSKTRNSSTATNVVHH
jgi:hypothetical protein